LLQNLQRNDNVVITAAPTAANDAGNTTSLTTETVSAMPTIVTGGFIEPGLVDAFTVSTTVFLDLGTGDGTYEQCNAGSPAPGQGLYNDVRLTVNGSHTNDDACADVPGINISKSLVGVVESANPGEYEVTYSLQVGNSGGLDGNYDLTDTFSPNNNVVVVVAPVVANDAVNTSSTSVEAVGAYPAVVTGGTIEPGLIDAFTVTATVRLDLNAGDGSYELCNGSAVSPGEGLYNLATLTVNGSDKTDTACGDLPNVEISKILLGVAPSAAFGEYDVTYSVQVSNSGGLSAGYALTDSFSPDNNVVVSAGPSAANDVANTSSATIEAIGAFPTIVASGTIEPGQVDAFTVTATLKVDLSSGDGSYETCTAGAPLSGEGLFNEATVSVNGVDISDNACGEVPNVKVNKTLLSVLPSATPGEFDVLYALQVSNSGGLTGNYDLVDEFTPNSNVVISAGPTAQNDAPNTTSPTIESVGPPLTMIIGGTIEPGRVDAFTISATVKIDLSMGDGSYEACNAASPVAGEGLYNQARMVVNGEHTLDDACGDLPNVEISKTLVGVVESAVPGEFDVSYSLRVSNSGGLDGTYDLTDSFGANDNVVISTGPIVANDVPNTTSGTTEIVGAFPSIVSGGTIEPGLVDAFTVTATVKVDLGVGDGSYESCSAGTPAAGEGLYNEAILTVNGSDTTDDVCADIPNVEISKTLVGIVESATPGAFNVTYLLQVSNSGGLDGTYDLVDTFSPNNNVVISAGPTAANDAAFTTSSTTETVGAFPGIVTGGTIEPGLVDAFTVTATVKVDLLTGDGSYEACSAGSPTAGEGLYNEATVTVNNNDTTDDACGDLPVVEISKTLVDVIESATPGEFNVTYLLQVSNNGALDAHYDLEDTFTPNDNVVISSGPGAANDATNTTSPSVETVATFPNIVLNGLVEGGKTDAFTVTATVKIDLTAGDGSYEACSTGTPATGEGLYNEATLTVNGSDTTDDACGDLPHVEISKTLVGVVEGVAPGEFDVTYSLRVSNRGGLDGAYDLTDVFDPNNNIVIVSGPTAANDAGNTSSTSVETIGAFPSIVSGGTIESGLVDAFTVTATVKLDLSSGDGNYEVCSGGTPAAGEGLYNQAVLTVNNQDTTDEACGDVPNVEIRKTVASFGISATPGAFDVVYLLEVSNTGGLPSNYDLTDNYSPNDNIETLAGPTVANDIGNTTSPTIETVGAYPAAVTG
ncbi:hypothetical protein DRQ25_15500, partial [Candidatus Fermentibacteria bacterium]